MNWKAAAALALMVSSATQAAVVYSLATTNRTATTGNTFLVQNTNTNFSTSLSATGGATPSLTLANSGTNSGFVYFFGNFSQQTLNVGDSLKIDYTLTGSSGSAIYNANSATSDGSFRVSLYNSSGTKVTSDQTGTGNSNFADDVGYMALYRTTSTGTNGTGNVISQRPSSGQSNLITTSGPTAVSSTLLTPLGYSSSALTVTGSLTLTRDTANSLVLTSKTGSNTAQSITDSVSTVINTFDEFAFTTNIGASSNVQFSQLNVTYTAAPEPACLAGIGLGAISLLSRRRRRV